MNSMLLRARVTKCVFLLLSIALISCGGGSSSSSATPPISTASSASPGNYIWQSGLDSTLYTATLNSTGAVGAANVAGGPARPATGYLGFATGPTKQFLYAIDTTSTVVRVFSISGPGIQLHEIPQSPFTLKASSRPLNSLSIDPSGRFLFIVESAGAIEEFLIDGSTGVLTNGPAVIDNSADFRVTVITPSGKFLYSNDLTGGRVFAYQIGSSGALAALPGSPFTVPSGGQPTLLALDASGSYLYCALYRGGIAAFAIDSSSGTLTSVAGSPFSTAHLPAGITASSAGFLYVSNDNNTLDAFKIGAGGTLSPIVGSPFLAQAGLSPTMDSTGAFLYLADAGSSRIYGFQVDNASGNLTPVAGSPFPAMPQVWRLAPLKIP